MLSPVETETETQRRLNGVDGSRAFQTFYPFRGGLPNSWLNKSATASVTWPKRLAKLLEFNEDVATLRRGLISHKLMTREKDVYRRTIAPGSKN